MLVLIYVLSRESFHEDEEFDLHQRQLVALVAMTRVFINWT